MRHGRSIFHASMRDDEEQRMTSGGGMLARPARFVAALVCGLAGFARADEAPVLGKITTYNDWTVGCDNGLVCRAISLFPEDDFDLEGIARLTVVRAAGPEAQ